MTNNQVEERHSAGYEAGVEAISTLYDSSITNKSNESPEAALAGLLQSVLNFVYFAAPNIKEAEKLIKFAKDSAYENMLKERLNQ
tara:strand:+ start:256 stop:510 length:255 start_codon:yes stop_codon:yes gene_type:complete